MIIKDALKNLNISNPNKQLDAIILLARAINKSKEFIYSHPEYKLGLLVKLRFFYYLRLFKKGWPVAYITKHKEFCGLDFYINKHVLIPRPETELMVEEVVKQINSEQLAINKLAIIDVGTGSGCIPISINKPLDKATNKQIVAYAIDVSHPALRVAKTNAQKHNTKIQFLHGDLLQPMEKILNLQPACHLAGRSAIVNYIITANLPYLTGQQFAFSPTIQHEPRQALIADKNDGLSLYKKLIKQIQYLISNIKYYNVTVLLEIDPSQTEKITKIINGLLPKASVKIKKDLAGQDRIVIISLFN